jgi:hydroxylamine oxidation protein HaoB
MKRFLMIGLLAMMVLLLITGCSGKESKPQTTLYTYEKGNRTFTYDFRPSGIEPCMDWIMTNTPEDAVFLCWWDYGHTIRDLGERDVIVFAPSREVLSTIKNPAWDETVSGEYSSHYKIQDVAEALLAADSNRTAEIMRKYNAAYIFIHQSDITHSWAMYYALGEPVATPTNTILDRALNNQQIAHFELVYSDEFCVVYKLVEP